MGITRKGAVLACPLTAQLAKTQIEPKPKPETITYLPNRSLSDCKFSQFAQHDGHLQDYGFHNLKATLYVVPRKRVYFAQLHKDGGEAWRDPPGTLMKMLLIREWIEGGRFAVWAEALRRVNLPENRFAYRCRIPWTSILILFSVHVPLAQIWLGDQLLRD